jgi:hypothetical protein
MVSLYTPATVFPVLPQVVVSLPAEISPNMVLQRDKPVPVWGTAFGCERVTIALRNQRRRPVLMHEVAFPSSRAV